MTFRCIAGKKNACAEWVLTQEQLEEWEASYPDMDILAECTKARTWLGANSLKTHDGMPAFLVNWFNRGQNGGRYARREVAPIRGQSADERGAYQYLAEAQRFAPPEESSTLSRLKSALKVKLDADTWHTWISPLLVLRREAGKLVLVAPTQRFVYTLEESFSGVLLEAAKACGLDSIEITTIPAAEAAGGTK